MILALQSLSSDFAKHLHKAGTEGAVGGSQSLCGKWSYNVIHTFPKSCVLHSYPTILELFEIAFSAVQRGKWSANMRAWAHYLSQDSQRTPEEPRVEGKEGRGTYA